jgi:hypothetical protein
MEENKIFKNIQEATIINSNTQIEEEEIDFYKTLYESIENESTDEDENEDLNCMITGLPLTHHQIMLDCNHKFNYKALYNEICKQKYEFKTYTMDALSYIQQKNLKSLGKDYYIKCPYCRNIQFSLLPVVDELYLPLKYGINSTILNKEDIPYLIKYSMPGNSFYKGHIVKNVQCDYVSICCVPSNTVSKCPSKKSISLIGTNQHYCIAHYEQGKTKHMNIKKQKLIEEKLAKKLALKQQKEEDKLKLKQNNKETINTKELIFYNKSLEDYNPEFCELVLKTGPNKGKQCNNKSHQQSMCLRHWNKNKDLVTKTQDDTSVEMKPNTTSQVLIPGLSEI